MNRISNEVAKQVVAAAGSIAAETADAPKTAPAKVDLNPVRLFFSYAREDADIVNAFSKAFDSLGSAVYRNVYVFIDTEQLAAAMNVTPTIEQQLLESDYLVVFYTGTPKRSHSWTGIEVGYFTALMNEEIRKTGTTKRKIVSIFTDEPPAALDHLQGISVQVAKGELALEREQYLSQVASHPRHRDGVLARFLKEVSQEAERRLPINRNPASVAADAAEQIRKIEMDIVPGIMTAMFDCLGSRVARSSIEQRLIEIELTIPNGAAAPAGIPETADLREHGNAFRLFKVAKGDGGIKWKDFCDELEKALGPDAMAIQRAMDRVFDTALSERTSVDNDQLIRSPHDDHLYRVVVTRHFDYFNGRKVVHMYFIEHLKRDALGKEETSILLAFINVAARYRSIFIEAESDISEQAFRIQADAVRLRQMTRKLLREIVLIEDEAKQLKLDESKAAIILYGKDADLTQATKDAVTWGEVRSKLFAAAERLLAQRDEPERQKADFLKALKAFGTEARRMNAALAVQAMERLHGFFRNARAAPAKRSTRKKKAKKKG